MVKQQVAGMVTLFNSQVAVYENILTYLSQVDKLFVIDNSDQVNDSLIDLLKKNTSILYYWNEGNKGIAHALNTGAELARQHGYKLLLTMDDDTRTPADLVEAVLSFLNNYKGQEVGLVSAVHNKSSDYRPYRIVSYTLTSGNIINLEIHKRVGGFWEELFIDHVDHEYCLRLNKLGYQVVELPRLNLEHSLGEIKSLSLGSLTLNYVSHHPIRMYYIARNGWLVAKRYWNVYPWFCFTVGKLLTKEWIKSLFLENNRKKRFHYLIKGIKDAWSGRMGKLY